jgi:hypothetical protein
MAFSRRIELDWANWAAVGIGGPINRLRGAACCGATVDEVEAENAVEASFFGDPPKEALRILVEAGDLVGGDLVGGMWLNYLN